MSQDCLAFRTLELLPCCLDGHYSCLFVTSFVAVVVVVNLADQTSFVRIYSLAQVTSFYPFGEI